MALAVRLPLKCSGDTCQASSSGRHRKCIFIINIKWKVQDRWKSFTVTFKTIYMSNIWLMIRTLPIKLRLAVQNSVEPCSCPVSWHLLMWRTVTYLKWRGVRRKNLWHSEQAPIKMTELWHFHEEDHSQGGSSSLPRISGGLCLGQSICFLNATVRKASL